MMEAISTCEMSVNFCENIGTVSQKAVVFRIGFTGRL
jgi:hypothetical protein